MIFDIKIKEITQEELTDLFSAGMTGSGWLQCDLPDKEVFMKKVGISAEEYDKLCIEDMLAMLICKGEKVRFEDLYAEDKDEINGNIGKWDVDNDCAYYMIGMDEIKSGLEKAGNGKEWGRECFLCLADGERTNLDFPRADCLMQTILFGELVYG